jgi:hypothetical protein
MCTSRALLRMHLSFRVAQEISFDKLYVGPTTPEHVARGIGAGRHQGLIQLCPKLCLTVYSRCTWCTILGVFLAYY